MVVGGRLPAQAESVNMDSDAVRSLLWEESDPVSHVGGQAGPSVSTGFPAPYRSLKLYFRAGEQP